jgi:hypothetical protein
MAERRDDEHHEPTKGEQEIEGDDPVTQREELELGLMDEGESEKGADIGEHID